MKKIGLLLLSLVLLTGFGFSATYYVTFSGGYTYGSGSTSYSVIGVSEIDLLYSYSSGGYAGVGFPLNLSWAAMNASPYSRMVMSIKSDSPAVNVYLRNGTGKSTPFHLSDVSANAFVTYEMDLSTFGTIDLTGLDKIEVEPTQIGSLLNLKIGGVYFDTNSVAVTANPLLITTLVGRGLMTDNAPLLSPSSNYRKQVANGWLGYKYYFRDHYQNIVNASVYGLIFDPSTGSSGTQWESNDNSTSEAAGYGMLLSVFCNDQSSFDTILDRSMSKLYKSSTGLFSWIIAGNGIVGDPHSAMDADQDIAAALVFADLLVQKGVWSNTARSYSTKAQALINAVYENDMEYYRYIRLGDYVYGGRMLTNPSYFSPAWYRLFARYEAQNHDWKTLIDQGYQTIASTNGYSRGLAPDWCDSWGQSVVATYPSNKYELRKDAIRVFWRLALDYLWFGESRAKQFLENTKTNFSGFGGSLNPASITCLNMNGQSTDVYTDVSLVGMYAAGAMGCSNTSYRDTWRSTFENYLFYSLSGPYSFFSSNGDTNGKYGYYNQSMAMFAGLILSGALPNIGTFLSASSAPSLAGSTVPANMYNKSMIPINLILTSTAGPNNLATVDIRLSHPTGTLDLGMNSYAPNSPITYQDTSGALQSVGIQKQSTQNQLYVTFNVVLTPNWNSGVVQVSWRAADAQGNQTGWQTLAQTAQFNPYPQEYVSMATLNVTMNTSQSVATWSVTTISNGFAVAMDRGAWTLAAYTDNIPGVTGSAGLARFSSTNTVLNILPIKMLTTSNAVNLTGWNDPRLVSINDRDDQSYSAVQSGTSRQTLLSENIYVVLSMLNPYFGQYKSMIYFKLAPTPNLCIDNFEDGSLRTELGTYWYTVAIPVSNTFVQTTVTQSLINGSYNNSQATRLHYTLGTVSNSGQKPQAMMAFNLNQAGTGVDVSAYKGVSFWIRSSSAVPLAMTLASTAVNPDYDYFLRPIHPLAGQWAQYQIDFSSLKQTGFGTATSLSSVLMSVNGIQFKTLSEYPGESGDVDIDEIEFY